MLKNVKVGTKVWSYGRSFGKIRDLMTFSCNYPIHVEFLKTANTFTQDGRFYTTDNKPDLFVRRKIIIEQRGTR